METSSGWSSLTVFLLAGILGRRRGSLFARWGLVASLLCLGLFFFRCFDRNLGVIRQTIGAGGDYALPLFQPIKNLHVLILPYSDLDCQLAGVLIGTNDHHGRTAVRGSQDGRGGNDQ